MHTLTTIVTLAGCAVALTGCLHHPQVSTCTAIGNRRPPTDYLERTAEAGFDAARNLVDSTRIIAIADSTMGLTPEERAYYITATFTRAPEGYLITRSPNLPNRRGGGALVWVGKGGDAQVIYFTQ